MDSAILLQDSPGEKIDTSIVGAVKNFVGAGRKSFSVVVMRGELLVLIPGDEITPRNDGEKPHNYRLKREPTVLLYCKDDGDDIAPLGAYEELLLEGIKPATARYEVFISANMLDWGSNLKMGDAVYVGLPSQHPGPVQYAAAVIRYLGGLKLEPGIQFGVEITERQFRGCGTTNGFWQGAQIFLCEENCGLFVGLDKLSPDRQGGCVRVSSSSQKKALLEQYTKIKTQLSQVHHEKQDLQERYKCLEEQLQQEKQQHMEDHARLEQQLRLERQETAQLQQEVTQERQETARLRQEAAEVKQQLECRLEEVIADNQRLQQQLADTQMEVQRTRLIQPQSTLEAIEHWKVPRRDIQTMREIGRGAWGSIFEGKFKDQLVAIKQPHQLILIPETIDRLQREIQIMAQVRHPNLVRFIAAVFDDKVQRLEEPPMIILELLDMNLRTAYKRDVLGASKIPIFRDVAYALHYLHEHQDPIIHRDISTPNVLLEALPQGAWKAKVSDFGSANLEKRSKTAGEGAIIYSAPETFPHTDPTTLPPPQTTKIDVFSYGILLCEVITKQLPEDSTIYRQMLQQVKSQWLFMYDLIVSCTKRDPNERPTMAQVLDKLNKLPRPRPRVHQHS